MCKVHPDHDLRAARHDVAAHLGVLTRPSCDAVDRRVEAERLSQYLRRVRQIRDVARRCDELLAQFHLGDVMHQRTELLPYGKRRLLEIAIALACQPSVLLLDEPVAGVPAGEREELLQTVAALPRDVSILLIEHDMDLVFSFATRMTVMVNGAVLTEGDPREIANDTQVKAVYLGETEVRHG